ncbi:dethiobiotin synthase [Phenylobacterium deserti]|uniref:ATP-dependent dethiobiotin synthetase BioD n=1 Tax=Phenylobacterium deserti TaxID=1914756 RepID=A0A328AQH4_9CAUL|nr:dethiobiotin synthase [Phenylobacterium deserti]RAK57263.1 dethiobiotin synthase [Phenylobacterium deserti]
MKVFIAGSHTEIGKTHVACALLRVARAEGRSVAAFKPVLSGFDPADWTGSDSGRLLAALETEPTTAALEAISPFRYAAPLAPPMAARLEGRRLELKDLSDASRGWLAEADADLALVESAGGLMSPIAEDGTVLDLLQALDLPSVLVGGSYLGSISHTLTALEVMRARSLAVAAVVVSEDGSADAPDFSQTVELVRRMAAPTPVLAAGRNGDEAWAGALLEKLRGA